MPEQTIVIRSQPGIKRDGTLFDAGNYADGQWCRFQRGLPRKMGGYRASVEKMSEICRGITEFPSNEFVYQHYGSASGLFRSYFDSAFNSSTLTDRTPAGYVSNTNNRWMFDYQYDATGTTFSIISHVAPNGSSVVNSTGGNIYIGNALGTSALTSVSLPVGMNAAGGIVVLHPYLFYYGADGLIGWSVASNPSDLTSAGSGQARVWGQKIIKGLPLRAGSGTAPAGIFWAYDAIIRATFSGGSTVFNFDVVSTGSSIMNAESVVDYDGVFYWAGVDRFLMFNGVMQEVPNTMNLNWFFDGLNKAQRTKVFAFKNPRFGEIWWCYPRGDATECTHAVIYNVRENTWYDTILPNSGRSAGTFCNAYAAPILTGVVDDGGYNVWLHESGVDEIDGSTIAPVLSYFETADISTLAQGIDAGIMISKVEPDFIQSGPISLKIIGRTNAKSPTISSQEYFIPETATETYEQIVTLREQRREMRIRFTSNSVGGNYQSGKIIAHLKTGDKRSLGSIGSGSNVV